MRPHGEIRQVLAQAAAQGPGSVRDLAQRAQVGYQAAAYTASRMLACGDLVVLCAGRPATLAAPVAVPVPPGGDVLAACLDDLHRSFWERSDTASSP